MVNGLLGIAVGLTLIFGGTSELVGWLRGRHRRRRVSAVIVGQHDPAAVDPGHRGRSAVFQFTTEDGQVIEAVSSAWTFPEPKVGKRIPVTYDPARPRSSAERVGVQAIKIVLSPLLIAGGLVLAGYSVTLL